MQKIRYSKNIQGQRKKSKLTSFIKDWCLYDDCSTSFFTLFWLKKKINTERKIRFVLLILQISGIFSYKLGFAALLATTLISLATVVFIIIEQTNQIAARQEILHNLCTQALLDHSFKPHLFFYLKELFCVVIFKSGCSAWMTRSSHIFRGPQILFLDPNSSSKNSLGNSQANALA